MEYNRIVAVTGMPGLYEVISSKTDGAIVRSLEDKSTKFVSSRVHNLSHLESIEVYTVRENVRLSDVFSAMKENGAALPEGRDNKDLKTYFETVYPDLDFDRVYASDMKKMIKWYEIITANDIDFTAKEEQPAEEEAEAETVTVEESEEPAKKTAAKKAAKPKAKKEEEETTASANEEKPKRGRKKKSEE